MQKKGRSKPSSVYSSMTCLLLFGPWSSSMRAFSGRPSVLRRTCTASTDVERVRAERAALDSGGRGGALGRRVLDVVGVNIGGEGELELANVADSDRVRAARGLDHGAERAELAVLDIHAHLARGVVRPVPELNVSVERAALGREDDLHLLHEGGAVRPGAERAALHEDRRIK